MAHAVPSPGFADTKRHYPILDALRGVAALMVVAFHLCEAHAGGQLIDHGYLAVDFFFLLSGFVIAYAYDDRWRERGGGMTTMAFLKRRLIRLHPMIVAGMLVGALMFYTQQGALFGNIAQTPPWLLFAVTVLGMLLVPVRPSLDIRGWVGMYPLNGPAWSLFYEYVANVLYALVLRRLSNTVLALCALVAGGLLVHHCVTAPSGQVIGGWTLDREHVRIGLVRLMYPFLAGLLLARVARAGRIRHAFLLSSLAVIGTLALPRLGGAQTPWINGAYEAVCIVAVFPCIVYLGAGGAAGTRAGAALCTFLGDISYPLYITHYPFVYTYMAWVAAHKVALADAWPVLLATWLFCAALAWACLKVYDVPVRQWLTGRLLRKPIMPVGTVLAEPNVLRIVE